MQDSFGRVIDYLRISITDRCNFRCSYCMPPEGVPLLEHSEILSYEELLRVIRILGQYGVNKIRITGGEPLIRKGIVDFIRAIREIDTVADLSITTNGSLLADRAYQLKKAGLDRVNISIDTLNSKEFFRITGGGQLSDVLQGIKSAMNAGLTPVKLNVVVTEVFSMEDLSYFIKQTYEFPIAVRFIEYMPVGRCGVKAGSSIKAIKNSMVWYVGKNVQYKGKWTRLLLSTAACNGGIWLYYAYDRAFLSYLQPHSFDSRWEN